MTTNYVCPTIFSQSEQGKKFTELKALLLNFKWVQRIQHWCMHAGILLSSWNYDRYIKMTLLKTSRSALAKT